MAHRILGVDLGSHTIKLARFDASFRKAQLSDVAVLERAPLPAPAEGEAPLSPADHLAADLGQVAAAIAGERPPIEEIAVALPAALCTFRVVELPFADARRIESVLGYELEPQLMTPLEELVIDHLVIGPTGKGAETRVMAVCAPRAVVERLVRAATELQLPMRLVGAAPLAYVPFVPLPAAAVVDGDPTLPGAIVAAPAPPAEPCLVLDVGHAGSTVCITRGGHPELLRAIPRGGRHLSEAIATTFRLEPEAAEGAKLEAGFFSHAGLLPETPGQRRMDECLREAMRPLMRELRQTMASYSATYEAPVVRVFVTGGGARLPGFLDHLGEELGLPVAPLPWPPGEVTPPREVQDRGLLAVGLGLAATGAAPQVNFRKGDLAYRTDYSFLRAQAPVLAAGLLAIFLFAGMNAYASLRGLRKEQVRLTERLQRETMELFGKERLDARAISEEVKGGPKGGGPPPIPSVTAFDVLDDIARAVPPKDKISLDILELDIKPKKVFLKATTETAQQVDDLAEALSKLECVVDVKKDKLTTVTGPLVPVKDKNGKETMERTELKQFSFNVETRCP